MTTAETFGFDYYMRHTSGDGKTLVRETRVWDKDRYRTAREAECSRENAKPENIAKGHTRAKVEQITREQYLAERRK